MAMQTFQSPDTHNEPEGEATVATETTLDRSVSEGTNAQATETKTEPMTNENLSQSLNAAETPAVAVEDRDVGPSGEPVLAANPPDDFDDEFLVLRPTLLTGPAVSADATSDATPMFSATAGNDALPDAATPPLAGNPPDLATAIAESNGRAFSTTVAEVVDHFQKITNLESQIANACELELELRDRLKSLRKNREGLVERLTKLKNGDDDADDELDDDDLDFSVAEGSTTATAKPATPDTWGADPIEVLGPPGSFGLTEKKVEGLRKAADAGHFNGTVRGLRDWIAKSNLWHRDVPGCGPKKGVDAITDALTSYMLAHPVADEPMTAEDERRSEAAAIALGHVKPVEPTVTECEATPIAVIPDVVVEAVDVNLAIARQDPHHDPASEAIIDYSNPIEAQPVEPAAAKKVRKPRAKKEPKPIKTEQTGGFRESNAGQLDRVEAMLSGESDPAATITNEAEANEAGRVAGKSDASCSANPFPRDHAFGIAWQAGWDATAVGAV